MTKNRNRKNASAAVLLSAVLALGMCGSCVCGAENGDAGAGEQRAKAEAKVAASEEESETAKGMETETEPELRKAFRTELGTMAFDTAAESESEPEKKPVVAIDPGHQGSGADLSGTEPVGPGASEMKAKTATGTEGRFSGIPEYELDLEISLLLEEELKARGYGVIMTRRDNDTALSNSERALMAYEEGGDIFIRIHANGLDDSSVSGALAMVPSPSNPYVGDLAEDSYLLGECILDGYCSKAGFESLGVQYYDDMTGINWSRLPVMILEMGFMTNESDDLRMADETVQPLMAEGIADGIDDYFEKKGW